VPSNGQNDGRQNIGQQPSVTTSWPAREHSVRCHHEPPPDAAADYDPCPPFSSRVRKLRDECRKPGLGAQAGPALASLGGIGLPGSNRAYLRVGSASASSSGSFSNPG